jgi:hypothetical protein
MTETCWSSLGKILRNLYLKLCQFATDLGVYLNSNRDHHGNYSMVDLQDQDEGNSLLSDTDESGVEHPYEEETKVIRHE